MDLVVAGAFVDGSSHPAYSDRKVLGVRLRKFCLWHRLLLNMVDSPFMRKGAITMFDIRTAVGICRLGPLNSRVRKPWLIPSLIYAQASLASLFGKRHIGTQEDPNSLQRSLQAQVEAFLAYAKDYLQEPDYCIIPPSYGKGYVPQSPRGRLDDVIEHVGELINFGFSEEAAWGLPIGKANVYRILARRSSGLDVDVITPEEKEFQSHLPPQFRIAK